MTTEMIAPHVVASRGHVFRRALRLRRTKIGLLLFAVVLLVAFIGPLVAPHSPSAFVGRPFAGPSGDHLLGTDALGRDVLSRVLHGGVSLMWMSFIATALGISFGVLVGVTAGFAKKWIADVIMAGADLILAFPAIVLVLLLLSMLGPHQWLIVLLVALTQAPRVARLTRAMTVDLRGRAFVEAAEVLGVPRRKIVLREVLPHLSMPLSVEFGLRLTWAVLLIASLNFLGFGVRPPLADWGLLINENRQGIGRAPLVVLAPAMMITFLSVSVNLIAEGLGRAVAGTDKAGVAS